MKPTRHALDRWAERFPGDDMALAFANARSIGKGVRKAIRASCPAHEHLMLTRAFQGVFYAMTRDRIVFVMAPPDTVITVFRLERRTQQGAE